MEVMKNAQTGIPEYSPDSFVDREGEIEFILSKVSDLIQKTAVEKRTVVFVGSRGIGKTWLLKGLCTRLEEMGSCLISFIDLSGYDGLEPASDAGKIIGKFMRETLDLQDVEGKAFGEMKERLLAGLKARLEEQPLVLLLDPVYELPSSTLPYLEGYLLGPLAVEPNVLIVMTSRGKDPVWSYPELRVGAGAYEFNLDSFRDASVTEEQLRRQKKEAAPKAVEIHEISRGNPLANYLLADRDDPSKALDEIVEGMLDVVQDEQRAGTRQQLEALCVLRSFDEDRVRVMLAAYHDDDSYLGWSLRKARDICSNIVQLGFGSWDKDEGGYVMSEPARGFLEHYLEKSRPELRRKLHEAACKLYKSWAEEYPSSRDRWQAEADHHCREYSEV